MKCRSQLPENETKLIKSFKRVDEVLTLGFFGFIGTTVIKLCKELIPAPVDFNSLAFNLLLFLSRIKVWLLTIVTSKLSFVDEYSGLGAGGVKLLDGIF